MTALPVTASLPLCILERAKSPLWARIESPKSPLPVVEVPNENDQPRLFEEIAPLLKLAKVEGVTTFAHLDKVVKISIYAEKVEKIPDSIKYLRNLQVLHLIKTGLKSVPDSICTLKRLGNVILDDNELTEFPAGLAKIDHICEIGVRGNPLPKDFTGAGLPLHLRITANRV